MKQLSIYLLAISLIFFGSIKVMAQTDCPNIEWMRFYNSDKYFSCLINHVDNHQNSIIFGAYEGSPSLGSNNFPAATTAMQNTFIGKLDSIGNPQWIQTAKTFTYGYGSTIFSPSVDSSGYIYTTIDFKWKTEFGGVTYMGNTQKGNALFVKMNPQGLILDTMLIKGLSDYFLHVFHVDKNGNLYCYADLRNTLTIDGQTFVTNGGIDMLVFKLNNQFQLQWARQIGGSNTEGISAIVVDSQNNIYITGGFNSPALTLGSTQLINPFSNTSSSEVFLSKLDNNGAFVWATQLGIASNTSNCSIFEIAIDSNENVYMAGSLRGSLSLNNNPTSSFPASKYNTLLLKYVPTTQQYFSLALTGGENYGGALLYLSHKNTMVLSGLIAGNDTVDFGIEQVSASNSDFYVLALDLNTVAEKMIPKWVIYSEGDGSAGAPLLVSDSNENIYLSGGYTDATGLSTFGNYTFPPIPPGGGSSINNTYQAKLGFLNPEVTDSNGVLTAVQDSAIYQWLDCDNAMQPVAGATARSFQPTQPGSYAVRVSNSFCSVVSECISTTGILETQRLRQTEVYPNPVRETLHLSHLPLDTQVSVFDVLGRAVYSGTAQNTKLDINTRLWSPGVYMLRLSKGGAAHLEKVVKE